MKLKYLLILQISFFSVSTSYSQGEVEVLGHLSITKTDTVNFATEVLVLKNDGKFASSESNEILKAEDPKPLPYYSEWQDYSIAYQGGTFYKYGNRVHFDGLIKKNIGSISIGDTICVLPVGYRPDRRMIAHAKQGATPLRLNIEPDGAIWTVSGGGIWIDITGISFYKNNIEIGDFMEGGIVFYIANPAEDLDGDGDLDRGLIAAQFDQTQYFWICDELNGTTSIELGTGKVNTDEIITNCPNFAYPAIICNDLELNGYSDWFLPSLIELKMAQKNIGLGDNIGNFTVGYYWSSSIYDGYHMYRNRLSTPYNENTYAGKFYVYRIRAIRVF